VRQRFTILVLSLTALASAYSLSLGVDAGPTHHSGEIDTNEVWYPSGNPHILDSDVFTGDNVTLTIMPGCTVQVSAGVELYTGYANPGSIIAVGKADSTIAFTSLSDTVPGFWAGIGFYANTTSTARLSYVSIEYAGSSSFMEGAVEVNHRAIRMDHCTVRDNAKYGVYCGARGYFDNFSNNTVTTSGEYPIRIEADKVRTLGAGNVLTGNTRDGILVRGENVSTTGTWLNHGVPYIIDHDVDIADDTSSPVLTIAAGTTLKLAPQTEFYIGYGTPGGLVADGTAGQITFTSSVNPPSPGDWARLSFYSNSMDSQCQLKNCKVEYGGYDDFGDIYIADCTPTVVGCDIGYSSAYGIYLNGSEYPDTATLRANNTFHDYVLGDIRVPGGGVEEHSFGSSRATEPANVVRSVLFMPVTSSRGTRSTSLLDISGRNVLDLHPGANDVRALAPGIYFLREARARVQAQIARKLLVTR